MPPLQRAFAMTFCHICGLPFSSLSYAVVGPYCRCLPQTGTCTDGRTHLVIPEDIEAEFIRLRAELAALRAWKQSMMAAEDAQE